MYNARALTKVFSSFLALLIMLCVLAQAPASADTSLYYARLLLKPDILQFVPSPELFNEMVTIIRSSYVENVTDERLQKGCEKELKKLYLAARLKDAPSFRQGSLTSGFIAEAQKKTEGTIPPSLVLYAAMKGLFQGLDDPYSEVLAPEDNRVLKERLQSSEFAGIGAVIEAQAGEEREKVFIAVADGGPAARAGIVPGDVLIEVDSAPASSFSPDMVTLRLRGKPGTTVHLKIRRSASGKTDDLTLTREELVIPSVTSSEPVQGIGYIWIKAFGARTAQEFDGAMKTLRAKGMKALVLDLRNDGGGYMGAGFEMASRFLVKDAVITQIQDRTGKKEEVKVPESRCEGALPPVILLVNGFTCSAAELLTAALKDHGACTIVGSTTFGKGCAQKVYELPSGAAMKLTTFYFLTPKGSRIQKKGVEPHILVPMQPQRVGLKNDIQLARALQCAAEKSGAGAKKP